MTLLLALVLESLADRIFNERTIFMLTSPKLLGKRNSGNGIRGFFTASKQDIYQSTSGMFSACRNNQPCSQEKSSINYKQKIIQNLS